MSYALNDQQIIRLHNDLGVPTMVHDVLQGRLALDDVAIYTLDVTLSEFQPDTALLAMALSAAHIAHELAGSGPLAKALGVEAGRIAHDIGPFWIGHADGLLDPSHETAVMRILDAMHENFEILADLISALRPQMAAGSELATISDIITEHAEIFMAGIEACLNPDAEDISVAAAQAAPVFYTDNVVAFPALRC